MVKCNLSSMGTHAMHLAKPHPSLAHWLAIACAHSSCHRSSPSLVQGLFSQLIFKEKRKKSPNFASISCHFLLIFEDELGASKIEAVWCGWTCSLCLLVQKYPVFLKHGLCVTRMAAWGMPPVSTQIARALNPWGLHSEPH